jgi:hypothetical protein
VWRWPKLKLARLGASQPPSSSAILGLFSISGGDHVVQMLKLVHDLCPDRHVESRARLVKHDGPCMRGQCSGDRDPLPLSAAEFVRK